MNPEPRPDHQLPVLELVPELVDCLFRERSAIVTAPPGTGKSTGLPLALGGRLPGRVIVTQPRRLAARMLGSHVARLQGVRTGESVGFAVRGERRETEETVGLHAYARLRLQARVRDAHGTDLQEEVIYVPYSGGRR